MIGKAGWNCSLVARDATRLVRKDESRSRPQRTQRSLVRTEITLGSRMGDICTTHMSSPMRKHMPTRQFAVKLDMGNLQGGRRLILAETDWQLLASERTTLFTLSPTSCMVSTCTQAFGRIGSPQFLRYGSVHTHGATLHVDSYDRSCLRPPLHWEFPPQALGARDGGRGMYLNL